MSTFSKRRIWQDRIQTVRKFYKSPKFAMLDLAFAFFALFSNPYRTCRKFLQKKGVKDPYAYGETPYSTYEKIASHLNLTEKDTWVEMGSGRGKGCFWLAHFMKCRVVGVEWVPQFIFLSRFMKWMFRFRNLKFERKDIEHFDLICASVIYLYGLWPKLEIPPHIKVITVSEPLEGFEVLKSFWVRFPWGRTRAFIQKKLA